MEWNGIREWNGMEWNGMEWNTEYGMLLYRGKIKRDLKTTI
jgi:hypothetical protein